VGTIEWQAGDRVYLDTNLFIYAVEAVMPFAPQIKPLWQAAEAGTITLVTSLLTLAETLVMPLRQGNSELVAVYQELFTAPPAGLTVVSLSAGLLKRAARLRAQMKSLYLPDAIHVATSQMEQCHLFVTNDSRLKAVTSPTVALLQD
jgi:predicted nucleic acid-binding protein